MSVFARLTFKRTSLAVLATAALVPNGIAVAAGSNHADSGPYQWCPGDDRGGFGGGFNSPADAAPDWDWNTCHTYSYVDYGQGNVSPTVWEGVGEPPASTRLPCAPGCL